MLLFADDRDFVERPGPSCNLHYICVVLCRGRAEAVQNDQEKKENAVCSKRNHIISGPNKQVIFESINYKICRKFIKLRPVSCSATDKCSICLLALNFCTNCTFANLHNKTLMIVMKNWIQRKA